MQRHPHRRHVRSDISPAIIVIVLAVILTAGNIYSASASVSVRMILLKMLPDSLVVVGNEQTVNWSSDTLTLSTSTVQTKLAFPNAKLNALPAVSGRLALTSFTGFSTGVLILYAGSTPPTGFLKCDGQTVSRTTYATLFNVIGTKYGAGNGSTTFALPNISHPVLSYGIRVE